MTEPRIVLMTNPVAVDRTTAAAMLCMSLDSFERHVQSDIKIIRRGKLRLVPVTELEDWARTNAKLTLGGDTTKPVAPMTPNESS